MSYILYVPFLSDFDTPLSQVTQLQMLSNFLFLLIMPTAASGSKKMTKRHTVF